MSDLSGEASPAALIPPHGVDEICATFGDIFQHITKDHTLDAGWQSGFLARMTLPFPLKVSWDHSQTVNAITCHKLLANVFAGVFDRLQVAGSPSKITSFGGCFSFRPQRTGTRLSTHAWGIAVDLNPETNQQGTVGNMDPAVITIFREAGFKWGGDWQGKARDPMHFQFCTGY
jgi:D-alanyl-D-alanine carboxypeptidase